MKTLKQIADEIGVPKQQVYRFVKAKCINEVHHEAHQSKSVKYYDEAAESAIKAHFEAVAHHSEVLHEAHHETHHEAEPESLKGVIEAIQAGHALEIKRLEESHRVELERLQIELDRLHHELEAERQHSRETADKLADISATLAQLTQNAQTLHAAQLQREEPKPIETAADEQPQGKAPSLFGRIFGRRKSKG